MDIALSIVFIGVMIFLSHYFSTLFARTKIPDVLFLFIIGILIGPVIGIIQPNHFGALGKIFTTITLVFILFEGSMGLCMNTIKSSWKSTVMTENPKYLDYTLVSCQSSNVRTMLPSSKFINL